MTYTLGKDFDLVFTYLVIQRRLIQTLQVFNSVWKEMSHKPSKGEEAKKFFPSVYVICATFFNECFSFHVTTERQYFLYKFIVTERLFATAMLLRSLN